MEKEELINCAWYNNIAQGQIKYDKNIVDLMKNKVILDIREYERLIRNDEKYNLQYDSLRKEIRAEFQRSYENEIRDLKNRVTEEEKRYSQLLDIYKKLNNKVKEYEKTGWWKRHFC